MEESGLKKQEGKTSFEDHIKENSKGFGGFFNAHAHIDRAFTYEDKFYSHRDITLGYIEGCSLQEKQRLVWTLHVGSAFTPESIEARIRKVLNDSIKYGVSRIDSCIDVTYNTKLVGWEIARKLKKEYEGKIDFRIGVYNVAGFKKTEPERFKLFEEAAKTADFIVALAEKDRKAGHIGEREHNIYMLNLGIALNKPVHFHVGQSNSPEEKGDRLLFSCMDVVYRGIHRLDKFPRNIIVHDISITCCSEEEFNEHCEKLIEYNVGVICCPSAAISMRQNRKIIAPVHNSLARVWDLCLKGIPVYLGTDNINDVFVPSATPDLMDEVFVISNSLRFYNPWILSKLACGKELDDFDRGKIMTALCGKS